MKSFALQISIPKNWITRTRNFVEKAAPWILVFGLIAVSLFCFWHFTQNGLSLAYNDARSHLNIGRRVVEGLKPGAAQLGSVWLPLPHILMIPTIWNDYFWHTGLSGAIQSMIFFVVTGVVIYKILDRLNVGLLGKVFGVVVFAANLNILYLQSTAMTELLLIGTMTLAGYSILIWHQEENLFELLKASFWIMLSTLIRYDGWFLCFVAALMVIIYGARKRSWKITEGMFILFCTLAGFGIFLWLVWNLMIFKDPLYFAFGPYSAHAQQAQLEDAGVLATKGNWMLSAQIFGYALIYNSGLVPVVLAVIGAFMLFVDKRLTLSTKIGASALLAPLFFNILALYLGHSVLFVQGISGNSWFNVRYGIMLMPSIAIFAGYLLHRAKLLRPLIIGVFLFVTIFQFAGRDAVTIDDGRVGSSQKNVSEVSGWIAHHAENKEGFILISAASHDAIIFSTGLPMKRFIHEGTGSYWESATTAPDRWARWIVMRTNDTNDQTFRLLEGNEGLEKYTLVNSFPFADIYELKEEYVPQVQTKAVLPKQR